MKVLLKGGRVITDKIDDVLDVLIEGETITAIGSNLNTNVDRVIDVEGKYILPGFIDPHVHIHLPFMGTYAKDDYSSASQAALFGGTTSLIEMICPSQEDDHWRAYQLWQSKAEGQSHCDFTFHMGITRYDKSTPGIIQKIVKDGVTSLKVFLAYKGAFAVNDDALLNVCLLAKSMGLVVTAHCENAELIASRQAELVAAGKIGPEYHEPSRPVGVEAEGVHHFCTFLEQTGASGYVVHTSCRDAVLAATPFVDRGVDVTLETVIPYLVLDHTAAEQANFEGAKYVMSPPIRSLDHQRHLWQSLADGTIRTVATDHAPFDFNGQKEMGRPPESDFTRIPNGIPSIEHRGTLLHTFGVVEGKINIGKFVELMSTNAAKRFGMYPQKGTLAVGGDADLVVWDPRHVETISSATHRMNTDYSGFEGMQTIGRAESVFVRGEQKIDGGNWCGGEANGKQIRRTPGRVSS